MNIYDLRAINTEKAINEAFIKLLKKKKFSEIIVAEICQKAGCSRNAFYSHFEDKEMLYNNLINKIINNMKDDCLLTVSNPEEITETIAIDYMNKILNSMKKEKDLLFILLSDNKGIIQRAITDTIYNSFIENAMKITKKGIDPEFQIITRFTVAGFVEVLNQCLKHNLPIKEVYRICKKLAVYVSPLSIDYLKERE